jgi:hypothetical protein
VRNVGSFLLRRSVAPQDTTDDDEGDNDANDEDDVDDVDESMRSTS